MQNDSQPRQAQQEMLPQNTLTERLSSDKTRRFSRLLLALLGLAIVFVGVCCIPPASFRSTKGPRMGRPLQKVAIVYSTHYDINLVGLERLHPFDIRKYAKIYLQLQTDGYLRPEDVFVPEPLTEEQILLVHTDDFLDSLQDSQRVAQYLEAGFVELCPSGLVDATVLKSFRWASGGTILAARQALNCGIAVNIGGGYHHAKPDAGEGFCVYNDLAIAIRSLQKDGLIKRACVIDLDVHQGNGTAVIFAGDDSVFTFSIHQGNIYPIPKETSDWDIELDSATTDQEYLELLQNALPDVLARAKPDIVFLQAGCDTLADDPLADLAMTQPGIVSRDALVIDTCVDRGIPVVMTLGGGYSPQAWKTQYTSIARTIDKYGLAGSDRPHPQRSPTAKESFYTK